MFSFKYIEVEAKLVNKIGLNATNVCRYINFYFTFFLKSLNVSI